MIVWLWLMTVTHVTWSITFVTVTCNIIQTSNSKSKSKKINKIENKIKIRNKIKIKINRVYCLQF